MTADAVLLLAEQEVADLLDVDVAYRAAEQAFELLGHAQARNGQRCRVKSSGMTVNVMSAIAPPLGVAGVKTYPVVRRDVTQGSAFTFQLFDSSGHLLALLRADTLGQRRTGAASAVAARHLARRDSAVLTVIGAGWQAHGQVEALVRVLPHLTEVLVVGRSIERAEALCDHVTRSLGIQARRVEVEYGVRAADVIVTATGSAVPVFDGSWLRPGAHISAVGSNYRNKREIDSETVRRADVIVVDDLEVARAECGELRARLSEAEVVTELGEVVLEARTGRLHRESESITIFDSHGLALLDVVLAAVVVESARAVGAGRWIAW